MVRVRRGRGCLLAHCAILSLNSRCLNVSHAARLTCQGVICTRFEDAGSRIAFSGMRSSLKKASHQLECIKSGPRHSWYAFFGHMLSSSQFRGDDLSRAVCYIHLSDKKKWTLFCTLAMQTLLTLCAETVLKLVDPTLPFLQRRPPWGPSACLIFLEQGNQRL